MKRMNRLASFFLTLVLLVAYIPPTAADGDGLSLGINITGRITYSANDTSATDIRFGVGSRGCGIDEIVFMSSMAITDPVYPWERKPVRSGSYKGPNVLTYDALSWVPGCNPAEAEVDFFVYIGAAPAGDQSTVTEFSLSVREHRYDKDYVNDGNNYHQNMTYIQIDCGQTLPAAPSETAPLLLRIGYGGGVPDDQPARAVAVPAGWSLPPVEQPQYPYAEIDRLDYLIDFDDFIIDLRSEVVFFNHEASAGQPVYVKTTKNGIGESTDPYKPLPKGGWKKVKPKLYSMSFKSQIGEERGGSWDGFSYEKMLNNKNTVLIQVYIGGKPDKDAVPQIAFFAQPRTKSVKVTPIKTNPYTILQEHVKLTLNESGDAHYIFFDWKKREGLADPHNNLGDMVLTPIGGAYYLPVELEEGRKKQYKLIRFPNPKTADTEPPGEGGGDDGDCTCEGCKCGEETEGCGECESCQSGLVCENIGEPEDCGCGKGSQSSGETTEPWSNGQTFKTAIPAGSKLIKVSVKAPNKSKPPSKYLTDKALKLAPGKYQISYGSGYWFDIGNANTAATVAFDRTIGGIDLNNPMIAGKPIWIRTPPAAKKPAGRAYYVDVNCYNGNRYIGTRP
ncbi:MAG: hypothetical protein FWG31_04345 [Oscillospiraceae bacterium]|nr:hypothetical protein [Oscillospiraceae bacterium]